MTPAMTDAFRRLIEHGRLERKMVPGGRWGPPGVSPGRWSCGTAIINQLRRDGLVQTYNYGKTVVPTALGIRRAAAESLGDSR